jgi:hypothetical protein
MKLLRKEIMLAKAKMVAVPLLYVAAAYAIGATIEYGVKTAFHR